jgi:hypothetical protein
VIPSSSLRIRKPVATTRPNLGEISYTFPPNLEQSFSQREYRNSPVQLPHPPLYPHASHG